MPLKTAVQRATGQVQDRRLQRAGAVVRQQKRVVAEHDSCNFLCRAQGNDRGIVGPVFTSPTVRRRRYAASVTSQTSRCNRLRFATRCIA